MEWISQMTNVAATVATDETGQMLSAELTISGTLVKERIGSVRRAPARHTDKAGRAGRKLRRCLRKLGVLMATVVRLAAEGAMLVEGVRAALHLLGIGAGL